MQRIGLAVFALLPLAWAAPLPKTYQELLATPLCQQYQCYRLPTDKQPATDQGVGTYLFLKKIKGSLFIRSKEGKLTALGWNLPVKAAKEPPTAAELNQALKSNKPFLDAFTQTFFSANFYDYSKCLKPQSNYPVVKTEGQSLEIICYYSSGELLFTGSVK